MKLLAWVSVIGAILFACYFLWLVSSIMVDIYGS